MGKLVAPKLQNRSDLSEVKLTEDQLNQLAEAAEKGLKNLPHSEPALPNFVPAGLSPPWESNELVEPWGTLEQKEVIPVFQVRPNRLRVSSGDSSHQWLELPNREQEVSYREWQLANPVVTPPSSNQGFLSTNGS